MTSVDTALLDRLVSADPPDLPSREAASWLRSHGLPGPHDEAWRHSPVEEILSRLAAARPAPPRQITRAQIDRLAGSHGPNRLVLVNGVHVPALSDLDGHADGMWIGQLSDLPSGTASTAEPAGGGFADGFQALNRAAGGDPSVVVIDAGLREDGEGAAPAPIHIVHVALPGDEPQISNPRTLIEVGVRSHLRLIDTFTALPGSTLTNSCTTIRLGREAFLEHRSVQAEAAGATHIGHTQVSQSGGSRYESSSVVLGADIARHAIDVTLHEPDAHVALTGLYRTAGHQSHDTVVRIDHAASRGTSTQDFRGVVDDRARGSFSGRIIVRPDTVANDAQQMNRNLVLQPTAQADTRPWLEIFAADVRCTHGATVGRLDDDALFYLCSRGIPLGESRAMLINAFIDGVTDAIAPAALRDHIARLLDDASQDRRP